MKTSDLECELELNFRERPAWIFYNENNGKYIVKFEGENDELEELGENYDTLQTAVNAVLAAIERHGFN